MRNTFFDVTRKFQINYTKEDKTELTIKRVRDSIKKQKIEQKENKFDKQSLEDIEQG